MPAKVRRAVRSDAESIARFQVMMAMETENKSLDQANVLLAVNKVFDDPQKGFYLVGEDQGRVVSSLMITYEWSDWRNSNMWYIQSVFVEAKYRGQGIFRQMYQMVLSEAKLNGVLFIRLYVEMENERAQKVYESLGMKRMPYYMYDVMV